MKIITIFVLLLAALALAGDKPQDTLDGRWVILVEDTTAVVRDVSPDGWYTVSISVPVGAKPGDRLLVASVRVLGLHEDLKQLQTDAEQTQSLLWRINERLDSLSNKDGDKK